MNACTDTIAKTNRYIGEIAGYLIMDKRLNDSAEMNPESNGHIIEMTDSDRQCN